MKRTVSCKASKNVWRVIKMGGADWMKDKLEWLLAGLIVYGGMFVFLVGAIFTMRGLFSIFTMQ